MPPMAKAAKTKSAKAKKAAPARAVLKKTASKKTTSKKTADKKVAAKKPAPKNVGKKPAAKQKAARKPAAKKPATKKPLARPAAPRPVAPNAGTPPGPKTPDTLDAFRPFVLVPPDEESPRWSLLLADAHSPADLFEAEGHSGNGYAWDSVARVAMTAFPEHRDAIAFNSEAGTFVAESEEKAAVIALGAALLRLLENEAELRTVIRSVPEEDWDD